MCELCPLWLQLHPGRMLMSARCKLWWMTPEWRQSTLNIPPETQFLLVGAGWQRVCTVCGKG
jgi:hypothetical protein